MFNHMIEEQPTSMNSETIHVRAKNETSLPEYNSLILPLAIFFFPRFRNKLATDILPIGDCGANVTMARSYGRL